MTSDAHGRPADKALTFGADDVRGPSHAERAQTLLAAHNTGTLCTIAADELLAGGPARFDPAGYPYGSFVTFALHESQPVFLISRIAEHTRNLAADPRASLLVHESGKADPLASARVTLMGPCRRVAKDAPELSAIRGAFLAVHGHASYYVDYADFDFWQLELTALRYIGGYGRMSWLSAEDFLGAEPDPLASASARILEHMNQDHADSLLLYARVLTSARSAHKAVMTAIDRYGFEMTISTPDGVGPARLPFATPLANALEARSALVALVREAEAKAGPSS